MGYSRARAVPRARADLLSGCRSLSTLSWRTQQLHSLTTALLVTDGALLVYDITDEQSFIKVKTWVRELRKIVGSDIAIAIAGNKCDLAKNRHVSEKDAIKCVCSRLAAYTYSTIDASGLFLCGGGCSYAQQVGAQHYHTSAKLNKGLDEVFVDLASSKTDAHNLL